jgi:hypothetical protein
VEVQLGQLMTIFEDLRDPPSPPGSRRPPGKVVAFKGTVKIEHWDAEKRMARGELVESLDVIERGAKGLEPGNRLFVVGRGDSWRRTLVSTTIMAKSRIRMEIPDRIEIEETPLHGDEEDFPEEVVAELRVIRAHRFASLAIITESREEIEPGDQAVARKGF